MRTYVYLYSIFLLLYGCYDDRVVSEGKIIGGEVAKQQYQFFAGLHKSGYSGIYCGGAFIDPHIVVTAAHCVESETDTLFVTSGEHLTDEAQRARKVAGVLIHPEYDAVTLTYDIALLFLDPLDGRGKGYESTIGLPVGDLLRPGTELTVVGFGNRSSYGFLPAEQLMEVVVPYIDNSKCIASYPEDIELKTQFCAGNLDIGSRDACQGDSGGPLFRKSRAGWTLHGIVSWGYGCAQAGRPGVYTKVRSFVHWIDKSIRTFYQSPTDWNLFDKKRALSTFCQSDFASSIRVPSQISPQNYIARTIRSLPGKAESITESQAEALVQAATSKLDCTFSLGSSESVSVNKLTLPTGIEMLLWTQSNQQWLFQVESSVAEEYHCSRDELSIIYNEANKYAKVVLDGSVFVSKGLQHSRDALVTEGSFQCQDFGLDFEVQELERQGDKRLRISRASGDVFLELQSRHQTIDDLSIRGFRIDYNNIILKLTNDLVDDDIFSWELSCPFPFRLIDHLRNTYDATRDGAGRMVIEFDHRRHPILGHFPNGEWHTFQFTIFDSKEEISPEFLSQCAINNNDLIVVMDF